MIKTVPRRRVGVVLISAENLGALLRLPECHKVLSTRQPLANSEFLEIFIEGPSLGEVPINEIAPRVKITSIGIELANELTVIAP